MGLVENLVKQFPQNFILIAPLKNNHKARMNVEALNDGHSLMQRTKENIMHIQVYHNLKEICRKSRRHFYVISDLCILFLPNYQLY